MPSLQKESALHSQTIDWETFVSTYRPLPNPLDDNASYDGFMLETFGPEFDHVRAQPEANVWTIFDCDGSSIIGSGLHHVNRLGYIITAEPVPANTHIEVLDDE